MNLHVSPNLILKAGKILHLRNQVEARMAGLSSEVQKMARGQIMQELTDHAKIFKFYFRNNGKTIGVL